MAGALALFLGRGSGGSSAPTPITPYFVSNANTNKNGGTAAFSLQRPANMAVGDVLVLLVESANQAIAVPTGFTQVTNSPQFTGTAAAAGGVRLAVFYQVVTAPLTTTTISIADSGDHTVAAIFAFRAANSTAPIDVTAGSVKSSATGTTFTLPSVTTSAAKALVLLCIGQDRDLASSTNLSGWTNANLTNLQEIEDYTVALGFGGGVGLIAGEKTTAGSTGTTDVTSAAATTAAFITVALKCDTAYFDTTKITGAYGSASDTTYGSAQAYAAVTLNSDGTITVSGAETTYNAAWVNNPASGVGSSYWVRCTYSGGGTGSSSGINGSWLAMTADRTWSVSADLGSQSQTGTCSFEFSTNSAGTNIVGRSTFSLFAQSNSGPIP